MYYTHNRSETEAFALPTRCCGSMFLRITSSYHGSQVWTRGLQEQSIPTLVEILKQSHVPMDETPPIDRTIQDTAVAPTPSRPRNQHINPPIRTFFRAP